MKKIKHQSLEGSVDFLGYQFNIYCLLESERTIARKVIIDLSENKKKRFQTRVILSALQFRKDGNFKNFYDRIRVLSGNYNIYDMDRNIRRNVGIYYNYRFIKIKESIHLNELDFFLKSLFLSKTGKLGVIFAKLSQDQRKKLLSLSFLRSFTTGAFSHFKSSHLSDLVRCWAYE